MSNRWRKSTCIFSYENILERSPLENISLKRSQKLTTHSNCDLVGLILKISNAIIKSLSLKHSTYVAYKVFKL
jgi:hypothetical protein